MIRAGVMPRLKKRGYVTHYFRSLDPQLELYRVFDLDEEATSDDLCEAIMKATKNGKRNIVIFFDQFEEFFTANPKYKNHPFVLLISKLCQDPLPIKFLFSLRKDFFGDIDDAFSERLPKQFVRHKMIIHPFTEEGATEVIENTLTSGSLEWEERLSELVASDLAGERDGMVLPSELQIIGNQMQAKHIDTVKKYKAHRKDALVYFFLVDAIEDTRDAEIAKRTLAALIDENGVTKASPMTAKQVASQLGRDVKLVQNVLNQLHEQRLVERVRSSKQARYELIHEYLIPKIRTVVPEGPRIIKANLMLKRYIEDQRLRPRWLIRMPLRDLVAIRRYADQKGSYPAKIIQRKGLVWQSLKFVLLYLLFFLVFGTNWVVGTDPAGLGIEIIANIVVMFLVLGIIAAVMLPVVLLLRLFFKSSR